MAQRKKKKSEDELSELDEAYFRLAGAKKKKTNPLVGVCIFLALLAACMGCLMIACFGSWFDSFLPMGNVTIGSTSLRGMTKQQAKEALVSLQQEYNENPMVIRVLDSAVELSGQEAGIVFDVEEAVNAAFRNPNCGQPDLLPYLQLDTAAVKTAVEKLGAVFNTTFRESEWTVEGSVPDLSPDAGEQPGKILVFTKGIPQYGLDTAKLYDLVMAAYNTYQFQVVGECSALEPQLPDLAALLREHYIAPVDAVMDEKFSIQPEIYGYGFDQEAVEAQLAALPYGESISIPFTRIPAEVTAEALLSTLYNDVLGEFQTPYEGNDDSNRNINLGLACAAIHDLVLLPGEEFSYNDTLGKRTAAAGYKPAPSYVNGLTVDTLGGGICQVSSTLYNCVLFADLEITERWHHGFISSYTDPGLDASVSWGSADFRFVNNTNYPIRIEAQRKDGNVTVRLLGTEEKDYRVQMRYEIVSSDPYDVVYREFPPENPENYHDGQVLITPYTGYKVLVYKEKLRKADDSLISSVLESTNEYNRRDCVVVKIVESATIPETTPETTPTV